MRSPPRLLRTPARPTPPTQPNVSPPPLSPCVVPILLLSLTFGARGCCVAMLGLAAVAPFPSPSPPWLEIHVVTTARRDVGGQLVSSVDAWLGDGDGGPARRSWWLPRREGTAATLFPFAGAPQPASRLAVGWGDRSRAASLRGPCRRWLRSAPCTAVALGGRGPPRPPRSPSGPQTGSWAREDGGGVLTRRRFAIRQPRRRCRRTEHWKLRRGG